MANQDAEDQRDKRIEDLKRRAQELSDGQMKVGGLDDCPGEMERGFLETRGTSIVARRWLRRDHALT